MKKVISIILLSLILCLFGCNNSENNDNNKVILEYLNIVNLPEKLEYFKEEELDLSGLIVEGKYNDGSTKIIEDYNVITDDFICGENYIKIEYLGVTTGFSITVKEIEKLILDLHKDYLGKINSNFTINSYDLMFENVTYGGYRGTNAMITYDKNNFVETNKYGYEVLIDEYGYVIDANQNVILNDTGYVLSGHGTSATALKELEIGDYVIYLDNRVFVYRNNEKIKENKLFIKFLQIVDKLSLINDIKNHNKIIESLNKEIILLDQLYENYNDELASLVDNHLTIIAEQIIVSDIKHQHQYSYIQTSYKIIEECVPNKNNYILHSTYSGDFYYGGYRDYNTIVLYDQSNIRNRNEYGYEVAVNKDNVIIDKDVLVDLPEDGYILSGHTSGADFIKEHLNIGDTVEIKDDEINFYNDMLIMFINKLINYRNDVVILIENEQNKSVPHDYKYIDRKISYVDKELNELIDSISLGVLHYNIYQKYKTIKESISTLYSQLIDYNPYTSKAMWYYPFEYPHIYNDTTLEGVQDTLDRIKEMGFNEIIIYPFYDEYALYDSDYFYKSSYLNDCKYGIYNNDYLECFINEAHKRGIIVNAFTQTFKSFYEGSKLLTEEHYQVNFQDELSFGNVNYYDICNDYVQDVLYEFYIELITKYDFDKIEYDIIRYPSSNLYSYQNVDIISNPASIIDHGYTPYSMNKFMTKFNLTGDLRDHIINDKNIRLKWLEFKENELISFITRTTAGIKSVKPEVLITAAVLNNYPTAKNSYLQDYQKWLELGIIDQIEPMVYSQSNSFVNDQIIYFNNNFNDYNYRIGLGYDLSTIDLMIQIKQSEQNGYVLFNSSDYLVNDFYKLLSTNHHNDNINIVDKDQLYITITNDIIDKIENYYEIKNNKNFDYLIYLIKTNDLIKLKEELLNLDDTNMSNYILNMLKEYY